MEKMNIQLVKLSECLSKQDQQYIKQNLQMVKEWYQYFNNQEEIIKQNQIGTYLFNVKRMIKALNLEEQQQCSQSKILQQGQENKLQEGIQLEYLKKNRIVFQICSNGNRPMNYSEKCISLFEMNQPGQGFILREQAKKINSNLYTDLFDQESKKQFYENCKKFLILNTSLRLCIQIMKRNTSKPQNNVKKYQMRNQNIFMHCIEKVIIFNQNMFLFKSLELKYISYRMYRQSSLIQSKLLSWSFLEGSSLKIKMIRTLYIGCFDKAIELDPNFAIVYINKALFQISFKQVIHQIILKIKLKQLLIQIRLFNWILIMPQLIIIKFNLKFQFNRCFIISYTINFLVRKSQSKALQKYSNSIMIELVQSQPYKNKGDL
ncbi:unnamed protein product [Paramecium sonneborni]|uniref:Uncharacterized protein n=1 Tax=Paramecium sonneborni TaxID=65129 RepID=A0A8S1RRU2_9CILI|nr:unnamed protein product [Paramecium sonneborni]